MPAAPSAMPPPKHRADVAIAARGPTRICHFPNSAAVRPWNTNTMDIGIATCMNVQSLMAYPVTGIARADTHTGGSARAGTPWCVNHVNFASPRPAPRLPHGKAHGAASRPAYVAALTTKPWSLATVPDMTDHANGLPMHMWVANATGVIAHRFLNSGLAYAACGDRLRENHVDGWLASTTPYTKP